MHSNKKNTRKLISIKDSSKKKCYVTTKIQTKARPGLQPMVEDQQEVRQLKDLLVAKITHSI